MNFEKFSDRARGFVQAAQTIAMRENHQRFLPDHLLKALLDDEQGLAGNLIRAAGGDPGIAYANVEASLGKQPKVEGGNGQLFIDTQTGKVFAEAIQNFSANPVRRVERTAQLAGGVDALDALARFKAAVAAIPNVVQDPAPEVNVLDFNLVGPVVSVRPYCHTDHYWQVYFDTNEAILRVAKEAGWPAPTPTQINKMIQLANS